MATTQIQRTRASA